MPRLDWLTARPVAHRGLHDLEAGVVENTGPAFEAAIVSNYGIECDVQISADGEAMVHHDDVLGRLTDGSGRLADLTKSQIRAVRFKTGQGHIMTLGELCDLVAGRVTLLVELKSSGPKDTRIAARAAAVLSTYKGPAAAMSFDPALVAFLRQNAPRIARGIVAERHYDGLTAWQSARLANLLHANLTRPDFVAYSVHDLPAPAPALARWLFGRPLLTWTVRTPADRKTAAQFADQVIFEGFRA